MLHVVVTLRENHFFYNNPTKINNIQIVLNGEVLAGVIERLPVG